MLPPPSKALRDACFQRSGWWINSDLEDMTLNFATLLNAMPGAIAQGLIWGIMAIGV